MSIARTMMLHSAIHWAEVSDPSLWPIAVQYATHLYNKIPDPSTGLCPDDLFTKTRWEQRKFHDLHVWGCPLYVLNKTISDGKKLPHWKPRASQAIFMGLHPDHGSTVPLVLNLDTGAITPQFHVVFDDWFTAVTTSVDDLPDFNSSAWSKMFGDSEYQFIRDEDDTQVDPEDFMTSEAIDMILPVVSLFSLRSNNSMMRTSQ